MPHRQQQVARDAHTAPSTELGLGVVVCGQEAGRAASYTVHSCSIAMHDPTSGSGKASNSRKNGATGVGFHEPPEPRKNTI
jgi:hypothetical protein